jgi:hypothetical protein
LSVTREEEEKRRFLSLSLFNVYSSARDDDSREQKKRSKNAYSGEDIFALRVLKAFFFGASVEKRICYVM